ncbi:MAG: helix-turn-helix domain-containing protein [Acidobacteria bacterium]|nr:helix-turn-helix domain-containing protein [Acidobacteriota bacterium]
MLGDDPLVTAEQVAAALGMSKGWVYAHATKATPRLPSIKIGGALRFRKSKVEEFILNLEREAAK